MGIARGKVLGMDRTELERPLGNEALREIERSLRAKLRSHRLSESFIDRWSDDALQKGMVEYLRAREAGTEVRDPPAFIVQAAFRRAIDELRREAREADGAAVEALLETGRSAAPPAEEVAIAQMSAVELHEAIDRLPAEERQALSLHYFEELSNSRAAEALYCSERTFRRRLGSALGHLSQAIGAAAPKPGSELALEIGVVSWTSLGGARVLISADPFAPLTAALESGSHFVARQIDRLRDPAARLSSTGASEQIGAVASGPAGKVIGGCAGAAILCALTGVVATNVDLSGQHRASHDSPPRVHPSAAAERRPITVPEERTVAKPSIDEKHSEETPAVTPKSTPSREAKQERPPQAEVAVQPRRPADQHDAEEEQLEEQMSGITRAAQEADVESPPSTSEAAPVEAAQTEAEAPKSTPSPSVAKEEKQVEEQFRGPLGP